MWKCRNVLIVDLWYIQVHLHLRVCLHVFAMFHLAGTIPAPVIFGSLIDLTCLWWSQSCDEDGKGSCRFYNNRQMSHNLLALAIVGKSLSTLFFFLSWFLYKPPASASGLKNVKTDEQCLASMDADISLGNLSTLSGASSGYETNIGASNTSSNTDVIDVPNGSSLIGNGDVQINGTVPSSPLNVTKF